MTDAGHALERIRTLRPASAARRALRTANQRLRVIAGGHARLRVIVLFAGVEGLASADQATVGAVAPQLEHSLHISNGQIGMIAAVAALAGALGTLPVGVLTDRVQRVRLLAVSVVLWSAAMVTSALVPSLGLLVLTRIALGAVTATAGPTVASLVGDFFPAGERAKVWGQILTGELLGSGLGVVVSGNLGSALSWRAGFAWLAIPGLALAVGIWKLLAEPARGGASRLRRGAKRLIPAEQAAREGGAEASSGSGTAAVGEEQELVRRAIRESDTEPHPELVLHEDPVRMPLREAVRYVLRVRTNLILILASSLGYLFFSGVQTFAVLLLRSRYGLHESIASTLLILVGSGALLGVVFGGRLADRRLRDGKLTARVTVGAVGYLAAAALFLPALASPVLLVSVPLFIGAGAAFAAPAATLNAARLDVIHGGLWGRAEGVRTTFQMLALALGPLLFGFVSTAFGGSQSAAIGGGTVRHSNALAYTFLIMLVPVACAGVILLRARRTYPRDVATATASSAATADAAARPDG